MILLTNQGKNKDIKKSFKKRFMTIFSYILLTVVFTPIALIGFILKNLLKTFKDWKGWYWNVIFSIQEEYK